jgi:hypothetical protein
MQCDASGTSIWTVMQNQQPITFESKKLAISDKSLSIHDKEMLALMHALEMIKQYLLYQDRPPKF